MSKQAQLKDPKRGPTAAGRADFKRRQGAHFRPGVKDPANTLEKMRRKGSFLRRMFGHNDGALVDKKGHPTQ
jgi:hypothetical protein